jgi:hypothetical protein
MSNQWSITVLSLAGLTFADGPDIIQDENRHASKQQKKGKIILFITIFNADA